MSDFDVKYDDKHPRLIILKFPYSLENDKKDYMIGIIKENINKIKEPDTITFSQFENNLKIEIYSLKNFYMVLSLLNLISTIHINLGMRYVIL